jgi:hypothetical protein
MATQTICDGCRSPLYQISKSREENGGVTSSTGRELMVRGERANGMQGGDPLPNGAFTWCERCARVAFTAVREAAFRAAGMR